MTPRMVAIVFVIASVVIMSAVSLAIGGLRGKDPPESNSPLDARGRPGERPRLPRLRC
jgi:hypothetical protein